MKNIYSILLGILVLSCTNENSPNLPAQDAKPIQMSAVMEKRILQDNDFGLDLLKNTILLSEESNVMVSPLSVSVALGMAWNGAKGETKTEIGQILKLSNLTDNELNEYYKTMQSSLLVIDPSTKLSIANAIWYREGFKVKPEFLKINSDNFKAYVKEIDFSKSWALDTINNWCKKSTKGLIPSILDEIPSDAMMYLMNAVYFKGIWREKFDKSKTFSANFTNELAKETKVNMMTQQGTFDFSADEFAQYIDLPYGNKAFSMTIILPSNTLTINDILNRLDAQSIKTILQEMTPRQVDLKLPRFKVENKFKLNDPLISMGMPQAFNSESANFSGISDIKLYISEVIHKTYITVDEEGTEAAAVTSIGFEYTSIPQYIDFNVNKPFLFLIREKSTGIILFMGKVGNVIKY